MSTEVTEIPLQPQLNKYQSLGKIALALSNAQKDFKEVHKNATANIGKYSYNYATLPNVIDAIKDAMNKHKLSFTQLVQNKNNHTILLTLIMHESGAVLESEYKLPDPSQVKPQEFASFLTYARRYSLTSALGIAADDDDDATIAQNQAPGDFVIPFGASKGKKIKELSTDQLMKTKQWCEKTDAKKFKTIIDNINGHFNQ